MHYLEGMDCEVLVVKNDESIPQDFNFDKIILSPGPGLPKDAGELMKVIAENVGRKKILGVCLGMQGIAEFLDGSIYNQDTVKHGVEEKIEIDSSRILFKGLPDEIAVGLYHSWGVNPEGDYVVTARSKTGVVMAIENEVKGLFGVQFHPESIMTEYGREILENFLGT